VKINFFHGALLEDRHLFNAGLEAKATRAIDIFENDTIDEAALKDLVRAAVALNNPKAAKTVTAPAAKSKPRKTSGKRAASASKKKESDLPKLSAPAHRALAGAGIKNLKQVSRLSEKEIKDLHGIGPNAINELRRALKARGLSFAKK
jgi:hypothetical protein